MKRMIAVLVPALLMTACAGSGSGQTAETDAPERAPVTELFEGWEELQGRNCKNFRLPEVIGPAQPEGLYRFPDRRGGADVPDEESKTRELLSLCFGERFDESLLTFYENTDGSRIWQLMLPDGASAAVHHGFPISIVKSAEQLLAPERQLLGSFTPADGSQTLTLKEGSCTVDELISGMNDRLEKEILPFCGGFELVPLCIRNFRSGSGACYAEAEYGFSYQGIMLEDSSPMFLTEDKNGFQVLSSYSASTLTLTASQKDDYAILSTTFSEQLPLTEELTEAIPLKRAVQLLEDGLAEYSYYEFDSVALRYCCLITAPVITGTDPAEDSRILAGFGETETAYFEPTWCFYYTAQDENGQHREAVKVNAVTGSLTIDK